MSRVVSQLCMDRSSSVEFKRVSVTSRAWHFPQRHDSRRIVASVILMKEFAASFRGKRKDER
jgi:hypothetical protein